ncbi:MAG: metalloregulator ArsR/SmtB family transcription factor [Agarilytica sp.]
MATVKEALSITAQDLAALASSAGKAAELLKAMSNENRLMILCSLMDGELSVSELNKRVPLSQSALSQHLAALRKAGLVATRRESQTIFYSVQSQAALEIIVVLKNTFCPE